MSKTVNEVHLIGRAGKDAETKKFASGKQLTEFSLATGGGTKKDGSGEYPTQWHNIKCWQDDCVKVRKGEEVEVTGRIEYESWLDKQTNQKKWKTVIVAQEIDLIGRAEETTPSPRRVMEQTITDEDIPF